MAGEKAYFLVGCRICILRPLSRPLSLPPPISGVSHPSSHYPCLTPPTWSQVPDFTVDVFQRLIAPKPFQIFQEAEQMAELKEAAAR